jgi:aryl-phospho-beta-D-glucosidase BglC (GH1 family)
MKKLLVCLFFLLSSFGAYSQQNLSIQELNKKIGKGVNMGNMFEAPSEDAWGNPFKDDYFQKIAEKGFNHVRIPIRWDVPARAMQVAPFTLDNTFLQRIKKVIDLALAQKLYVVINMHHHEELFVDPEKSKTKFLSQWTQIAAYFKDYDQRLIFEVMNEPHDKVTPEIWNTLFADALTAIRKTNPTRAVLLGTAEYGGLSAVSKLKIPDDKNLIVTVHYYNPFNFTHQGADWVGADATKWLGTKWEDLVAERNQVISEFEFLNNWSKQNNLPVHIGEFGAYDKADLESRTKWTNFLARWFELQGFSWAYWEFSAGFGIYNPSNSTFRTGLVDALISNPMPTPKVLPTRVLYKSTFDTNTDGFGLGVQPTSSANMNTNAGKLVIDVKSASANGWHVQLVKPNIALVNGKRYSVTIKGLADKDVAVTCYLGKNATPYNSYSGYSNLGFGTKEKEMSFTFSMVDPTDLAARLSFDMGTTIAKIEIASIIIEEILSTGPVEVLLANENNLETDIVIWPNPSSNLINIKGLVEFDKIKMIDQNGITLKSYLLNKQSNFQLDITDSTSGIYLLLFEKNGKVTAKRVLKL